MKLNLSLENVSSCSDAPDKTQVCQWVSAALAHQSPASRSLPQQCGAAELSVMLVDEAESAELNQRYRHREGPTNVLSFPAEVPDDIQAALEFPLLGDLVICAPVVAMEARQQHKPVIAHWAHMLVHGSLHLIGYDHIDDQEAAEMEQLEIDILARCGFSNPYLINNNLTNNSLTDNSNSPEQLSGADTAP